MTMLIRTCPDCQGSGRNYWSKYGGNDPDVVDRGPCVNDDCHAGEVPIFCEAYKCKAPAVRIVDGSPACEEHAREIEAEMLNEDEFREERLREGSK